MKIHRQVLQPLSINRHVIHNLSHCRAGSGCSAESQRLVVNCSHNRRTKLGSEEIVKYLLLSEDEWEKRTHVHSDSEDCMEVLIDGHRLNHGTHEKRDGIDDADVQRLSSFLDELHDQVEEDGTREVQSVVDELEESSDPKQSTIGFVQCSEHRGTNEKG